MKKVTDLKENECIHCATKEEFKAILELNPKNTCEPSWWRTWEKETIYFPYHQNQTGTFDRLSYAERNNYPIHTASDFLQPTYQLTKSQIIQIAEDGSLVKELFPDVFEEEYTESGWYYATCHGIEDFLCHFENPKTLTAKYWFNPHLQFIVCEGVFHKIQRKAKTEEVETALVNEAKRRYVNQNVVAFNLDLMCGNPESIKLDFLVSHLDSKNRLWIKAGGYNAIIFENGNWASIIQTPTDVIKVIETYGTDKLITLIKAYNGKN